MLIVKLLFFSYAPLILGVAGVVLTLLGYSIDKLAKAQSEMAMLGTVMFVINVTAGVFFGITLRNLHRAACTDVLTDVYNRRYFFTRLPHEMRRYYDKSYVSLIVIDIDNFKLVNDRFGHPEGDIVIKKIAGILKQNIRKNDIISRIGGDEFALILPNTPVDGAHGLAERMREIICNHNFKYGVNSYQVTVSIGIASSQHLMDENKIIKAADQALYQAKETKNHVVSEELAS